MRHGGVSKKNQGAAQFLCLCVEVLKKHTELFVVAVGSVVE